MCLRLRYATVAVLAGLLVPSVALACLWDHDTIKMERTRFPNTLELIAGKFLRHSPEFYQWRIEDRLKRLESDSTNPALLDDLAVAYDKIGQHDKAIETALKTEQLHPGRYETAANLGTFYIHAGRPKEGLPHIDRALKINPDAHFGREKYQKLLVEYVLERRKGGPLKLPLAELTIQDGKLGESARPFAVKVHTTFAHFVHPGVPYQQVGQEAAAAVKGVLGMMTFGKHDSPVLLEALGTLLSQDSWQHRNDAKLLAARAYLKASYLVPEGPARVAYRTMAAGALYLQTPGPGQTGQIALETVEADFKKELTEAREWYADLRERELSWIRDGKDPEAEFDKLYVVDPEVSGMDVKGPMTAEEKLRLGLSVVVGAFVLALLAALVGIVLMNRRSRKARAAIAANKPA